MGGSERRPEPTEEQRRVLSAPERSVFVAAGAGTGKTFLLVERYVQAVEEGYRPRDIPTVTFTRKAAGEIRERVRAELERRGRQAEAWDLNDAPITTIHGLCSRLLRESPVPAGVDPMFSVMAEEQAAILCHEAFEETWVEKLRTASDADLEISSRHGQKNLHSIALDLYRGLRGAGFEEFPLQRPATRDLDEIRRDLSASLRACREGILPEAGAKGTTARNVARLAECEEWLRGAEGSWEDLVALSNYVPSLSCDRKSKPMFTQFREDLLRARNDLGARYLSSVFELINDLLVRFHERYSAAKEERGALDFEDLELRTRALLESGIRPFSGRSLLIVDEFQDTNSVQCAILDRLGAGSLITVGDEYQSIYGFRGADVQVFRDRRGDGAAGEDLREEENGSFGFYPLSLNFRSTPRLLEAINHVFKAECLLGPQFPFLEPARKDFDRGRGARSDGAAVEVLAGSDSGEGRQTEVEGEARVVAERVASLCGEEGFAPGDIAVLLRALTHVTAFERAFSDRGLAVHVVRGRDYYERRELEDVLALLRLLVDHHDDASLITVLRSPLVGVGDDTLFSLRKSADQEPCEVAPAPLWEGLRRQAAAGGSGQPPQVGPPSDDEARLVLFLTRFWELEDRIGLPGLAALVEEAIDAFDYDLYVLSQPDGALRLANLRKLMRIAEEYEAVEGPGLAGFVAYVEQREKVFGQEGNAPLLGEEEDVIRIMTIHQAKGLEFPVVVVPDLGRRPGRAGAPPVRVGRDGRWAFMLQGPAVPGTGSNGPLTMGPWEELDEERERRENEEACRVLYVAATRAEERLVLAGTVSRMAPDTPLGAILLSLGMGRVPEAGESVRPSPDLSLVVRGPEVPPPFPGEPVMPAAGTSSPPACGQVPMSPEYAGPWRLSFSDLDLYRRCPRRFRLESVLGLQRAEEVDATRAEGREEAKSSLGREVGQVVHRVLERLPLEILRAEGAEGSALDSYLGRAQSDLGLCLPEAERRRAAELCAGLWRTSIPRWLEGRDARMIQREMPFAFTHGQVLFTGVMDMTVRDDGEWQIADFKTNRVERGAVSGLRERYELQVMLYGLAALRTGGRRVEVRLVFLDRPEEVVRTTFTAEDDPALSRRLEAEARGIVLGDFRPRPGDCAGCPGETLLGCGDS